MKTRTDRIILFSNFQPPSSEVRPETLCCFSAASGHAVMSAQQTDRLPPLTNRNTKTRLAKEMHPETFPKSGSPFHCP